MGAFNDVRARLICPSCANDAEVEVQFKYGSVWQNHYAMGDTLRWGTNDVGQPGRALVIVDGEATTCPACGHDGDWPVYVTIERDIIQSARTATGEHDFAALDESFVVIEASPTRHVVDA